MITGPAKIAVSKGSIIRISADGDCKFHALSGSLLVDVLGSGSALYRKLSPDVTHVEVKCSSRTKWKLSETFRTDGKEYPDQTPVELAVGLDRPLTLREEMKRFIREEIAQRAQLEGAESFDEANDFDIEDEDPDPISRYEIPDEMTPEYFEPPKGELNEPLPSGEREVQSTPDTDVDEKEKVD